MYSFYHKATWRPSYTRYIGISCVLKHNTHNNIFIVNKNYYCLVIALAFNTKGGDKTPITSITTNIPTQFKRNNFPPWILWRHYCSSYCTASCVHLTSSSTADVITFPVKHIKTATNTNHCTPIEQCERLCYPESVNWFCQW